MTPSVVPRAVKAAIIILIISFTISFFFIVVYLSLLVQPSESSDVPASWSTSLNEAILRSDLESSAYEFLKRTASQTTPLLLLDDIFDKLDAQRVEQIVRLVASDNFGQIFITDTRLQNLPRRAWGDSVASLHSHRLKPPFTPFEASKRVV